MPGIHSLVELSLIKTYSNSINSVDLTEICLQVLDIFISFNKELNIEFIVVKLVMILNSGKTKEW